MTEQTRRASRLLEIERLLRAKPGGMSASELARELNYSQRTIERDIIVLESELGVPLMDAPGRRYRIMPGSHPLGPVRFNIQEARALFLATRLLLRHTDERDPDGISALEKIAEALIEPVRSQIAYTANQLKNRPSNRAQEQILRVLTEAWASTRTVTISYRSQGRGAERATDVDPYFLEPSPAGAAIYLIGFSSEHGEVRTFKVDRVARATLTTRTFDQPDLDAIRSKMERSWGVVYGDDQYDIVIDFTAEAANRVQEEIWHPSQRLTPLEGGAVRLELRLPSLLEFVPWVRGWGAEAYVHAPEVLRKEIAETLTAAAAQYN